MRNFLAFICLTLFISTSLTFAQMPHWVDAWPETNFSRTQVDLTTIQSGGPPRDGIPSIDNPQFELASQNRDIPGTEPVISLTIDGESRAYPIRLLMWHEIVNDVISDVPIAVTYCPLCNASVVFDRRVGDKTLSLGTSGLLRYSDMVIYDRSTHSLWQQFTGVAIIGDLTGKELIILPSRTESLDLFRKRRPNGKLLRPPENGRRLYGANPYEGYDQSIIPFLYDGKYEGPVPALSRVVAIGDQAWPLSTIRGLKRLETDGLVIEWKAGQNSALGNRIISRGQDIGNVTVTKNGQDIPHHIPFAFAFAAFNPDGIIHILDGN